MFHLDGTSICNINDTSQIHFFASNTFWVLREKKFDFSLGPCCVL